MHYEKFGENIENSIKEHLSNITHTEEFKKVSMSDKIKVGCNHCGNCCMSSQTRVNAFDIYNISKALGKKKIEGLELSFSNVAYIPMATLTPIKVNGRSKCAYLKANNNGDFECILGDNKPTECTHNFLAVATCMENICNFVPLGQEVPKEDVDKVIDMIDINKSQFYYLPGLHSKACKVNNEVTVSDYLDSCIKHHKENALANFIPVLLNKYVKLEELIKIIALSENSSVNNDKTMDLSTALNYEKISKTIFINTYFYFDTDSKESFLDQTIKHIKYLEEKKYPVLRLLYESLLELYNFDSNTLNTMMNSDLEKAQKMFDEHFIKHREDIKNKFFNEIAFKMFMGMNKFK